MDLRLNCEWAMQALSSADFNIAFMASSIEVVCARDYLIMPIKKGSLQTI
jgi:hypothetical protein